MGCSQNFDARGWSGEQQKQPESATSHDQLPRERGSGGLSGAVQATEDPDEEAMSALRAAAGTQPRPVKGKQLVPDTHGS